LTHVVFQFDILEQDALDVLLLIRSWRNRVAPINRIPPEILVLLPDFWDGYGGKDADAIALTHVCRAWREVFISRSSLWTDLNCANLNKAGVYLKRSKPLPINLSLDRDSCLSPYDPIFYIIDHAIGRLRSLSINGTPENLRGIITHLPHPAPLLEKLSIHGGCDRAPHRNPVLRSTLFDGDLSSLRELHLEYVRTQLPWRNAISLTSFVLAHTAPGEISVTQFLDFFENAPNLRKIGLYSATPTSDSQSKRLVLLPCLERMHTTGGGPSSLLLDHLLIPVGAHLATEVDLPSPPITDQPPRFLDNLWNLRNFTTIRLYGDESFPHMQFNGPNGEVRMSLGTSRVDRTCQVLGSLTLLDTSKTERLEIVSCNPPSSDPLYRALLPMKNLQILKLTRCRNPHIFVRALHPGMRSSGIIVCPNLGELVLKLNIDEEELNIQSVIGTVEARASRGTKLGTVKIVDGHPNLKVDPVDVLELRRHTWYVDYCPGAGGSLLRSDEED